MNWTATPSPWPPLRSLYFDSLTNNSNLRWSLSGPTGTPVSQPDFQRLGCRGNLGQPGALLARGRRTRSPSRGRRPTTGAYSFRLLDLSQATALTPGTPVSGSLSPANTTNIYRFTATAGDKYSFTRTSSTGTPNAYWRLIDPYGSALFNSSFSSNPAALTVAASGTYTLLVEGGIADSGTGTYTLNVQFQGNTPVDQHGNSAGPRHHRQRRPDDRRRA